jgi:hypothetical protein
MQGTQRFAFIACVLLESIACAACGGDYWLGGARGATAGSAGTRAMQPVALHDLSQDIVLTGNQSYEVGGAEPSGCRILGHGHSIRSSGTWTGRLSIRDCEIVGLGSASDDAISLEMSGSASVVIEASTFDQGGAVHLTSDDDATVTFRDNVILENSLVQLDPGFDASVPAFFAQGSSNAAKLFQGNRIYRSDCWFRSPNWLIGGNTDRESNLLIGPRAGFVLDSTGLVVRGNYVHTLPYPSAGDEAPLTVIYGTSDALAEHNVLRSGSWVVRGFGGELRYNALVDADSALFQQPFEHTKVHHNLLLMCEGSNAIEGIQAAIQVVNARKVGIEIFNNTLDGGGSAMLLNGTAVSVDDTCFVDSLRSNLIFDFPFQRNDHGEAAIRPGITEGIDPPPPRLGYADYNLFYNPQAATLRNYALSVANRVLRKDAGFALHDAHAMGPPDEQVEPGLVGSSAGCFPYDDADIKAGSVTVSRMLAGFRAAYSPHPDSPLLQQGDPADGSGSSIGAVGDGTLPTDLFGKL